MNTQTLADRFFGFPLRCLVLALVLLALWVPIATRYRLRTPTLTAEQIETSRTVPADALLDQLAERQLMFHYGARGDKVAAAERVLRGEVDNSGRIFKIQFPFAPGDLETPRVEDQLFVGSLGVVRILLDGYQASGRPEFLRGAADVLVAFSRFERSAWSPKGRMWNDHALAEQLYVLTDFWRLYRRNPIYQPEVARVVLEQAARGARRLTRPSLFSYWGNHGVMQNLALWHVALAFPHLPGLKDNAPLAFERLQDVMRFYLNEEGVVLEHSSLYQAFGIEKLGHAFWYMHLARQPIPSEWIARYERAIAFYAQLRRPNRSLPTLGDTTRTTRLLPSLDSPSVRGIDVARIADHGSTVDLVDVRDWGRPQPASLHPVAGYATWWDGLSNWPDSAALAQTLVAWSYFPGHAHKHADELTVLFWAGGQDWWSNSGYWSTGDRRRSEAISWGGSNAPHLIGEPADSVRQTSLLGSATTENLAFLDLERCGPADFAARR